MHQTTPYPAGTKCFFWYLNLSPISHGAKLGIRVGDVVTVGSNTIVYDGELNQETDIRNPRKNRKGAARWLYAPVGWMVPLTDPDAKEVTEDVSTLLPIDGN